MEELNPEQVTESTAPESSPGEFTGSGEDAASVNSSAPSKKAGFINIVSAVFNGIGIGFLLGMLWSLSVSPVIGGVIATLSSLLALFLGLSEKYLDPLKSMRIGAFGLSAAAGVLLGLYIRTNDPFTPTMKEKMDQYLEIGYTEAEARAFITRSIEADTGKTRREANVLYSGTLDASACDDLQYAQEGSPETVNTFKTAGGVWKDLAEAFENDLPEDLVGKSLILIRDVFCSMPASDGKIEMENITRTPNRNDSLESIENVLSSSGPNWRAIVAKISGNIPEKHRKTVYLSIIEVLSNEN